MAASNSSEGHFAFVRAAGLLVILCMTNGYLAGDDSSIDSQGSISVMVSDKSGRPISNAEIEVFRWTGQWQPTSHRGRTTNTGTISLNQLPCDESLIFVVRANGYAATQRGMNLSEGEARDVFVQLAAPARCWLRVTTEQGKPLENVQLSRLRFTDEKGNTVSMTEAMRPIVKAIDGRQPAWPSSNSDGRLQFPEVPVGCSIKAWLVHPDHRSVVVESSDAFSGPLSPVQMVTGVKIQVRLTNDSVSKEALNGMKANVLLMPRFGPSSSVQCLRHTFPIEDGTIKFTALPDEYQSLNVSLDAFFSSSVRARDSASSRTKLDLRNTDRRQFSIPLFPKVKARGQIVDQSEVGVEGVHVSAVMQPSKQFWDEASTRQEASQWISGGNATSDADGWYEILVAAGPSSVEIYHPGYFAVPDFPKFDSAADGSTVIPKMVIHPVRVLRGAVVSDNQQPISGAVVRIRSTGYGDADPISITDADGKFELRMSRIPYAAVGEIGGLQTDVFVVAFDPNSQRCGRMAVDLADASSTENIVVDVQDKQPSWVLDPLSDQPSRPVTVEQRQNFEKKLAERRQRFSDGVRGKQSPAMAEGTWLNTNATSLQDLRGQYVLLDFWFIGCGPCHRDMPSIKMAHKIYSPRNFTVVSVHNNSQTADSVQTFARTNELEYPIVVDNDDGSIMKQFQQLGISSFPSYVLLSPDGIILLNDAARGPDDPILRKNKLEAIYHSLMTQP